MDYAAVLIGAAKAFLPVREHGKPNHGEQVELFLQRTGLPGGYPWCAAFVAYVGYYAFLDNEGKRSLWPLPLTAGCQPLADYAKSHDALVEDPVPGDVFLVYFPSLGRFAHTGVVLTSPDANGYIRTIEGNTNDDGSRDGIGVFFRSRKLDPRAGHRFIRWVSLVEEK